MSNYEKIHFGFIRFVHETLYGLFVNPYEMLKATGLKIEQKALTTLRIVHTHTRESGKYH